MAEMAKGFVATGSEIYLGNKVDGADTSICEQTGGV
jgi:hypothetical protein